MTKIVRHSELLKFKNIPKKYRIKKTVKENTPILLANFPETHDIILRKYIPELNIIYYYNRTLDILDSITIDDNVLIKPIKKQYNVFKFYKTKNGRCIFSCKKESLEDAWNYFLKKYNYIPSKTYYIV